MSFQKIIKADPAYDKREDPKGNFGIHGVQLVFILVGEDGAVEFSLATNWQLPHVQREIDQRNLIRAGVGTLGSIQIECSYHPQPFHIGYHSKIPRYEDQSQAHNDCKYTGGACYSDLSFRDVDKCYLSLLTGGDEGVWMHLEDKYKEIFKGEKK